MTNLATAATPTLTTTEWIIDPGHTVLEFSIRHLMISTVRGRFTQFNGTLLFNEAQPERSRIEGSVDVASLESHDAKRDEHLRSPDFFDVHNYPTLTFKSKRIESIEKGRFSLIGDLKIKNITREIVLDVTSVGPIQDPWGNQRWGFSVQAVLNRKEFGLTWNLALEAGGWAVGDEVKVLIELEATRKQS